MFKKKLFLLDKQKLKFPGQADAQGGAESNSSQIDQQEAPPEKAKAGRHQLPERHCHHYEHAPRACQDGADG